MKPPKGTLIPFHPYGARAWLADRLADRLSLYPATEQRVKERILDPRYGTRELPSKRGSGEKFHAWLFREYGGAEVVVVNRKGMIRFTDEQYLLMFVMRWSEDPK